jgi:hypothetical protein
MHRKRSPEETYSGDYQKLGVCSAVSIPLKNGREAFGLLDIGRHEPFIAADMKRIETIAGQLVNIIRHKQAEEA